MNYYRIFFKPFLDITTAIIALFLFLPVIGILFVILLVNNRGQVFFLQQRPGRGGKLFNIIKFRTMGTQTLEGGELMPDADRLTALGAIIRKLSLDELPQLFNVIKGDMSIVGPRPLLPEYLDLYNSHQARRHEVKPGITGWAQVQGRNIINWKDRLDKDVWYIDHQDFMLDLRIIFQTITKVVLMENVNTHGQGTMERFKG